LESLVQDEIQRLLAAGRWREAVQVCETQCRRSPSDPEAWFALGSACVAGGRLSRAAQAFRRVLDLREDDAVAAYNLGRLETMRGRPGEAVQYYRRAIAADPGFYQAFNNLGNLCYRLGWLEQAEHYLATAVRLHPQTAMYHHNLGNVRRDLLQIETAVQCYREALRRDPAHREARSNLLFHLSYYVLCSPRELLDEHRAWDRVHGGPEKARTFEHRNVPAPGRRLRVGYVSANLREHPVAVFLEPVLRHHDPAQVTVYCYAAVAQPDAVTRRLRELVPHWRDVADLDEPALARRIHEDGIDILVDLAGHTADNRLVTFAHRPAPVQVTYLGYCATTGLAAMDYWITDEILHPAETAEEAVETIHRLPRCWLCYQPPHEAPAVVPRAGEAALTFASFNDLAKLTPRVIRLWSRLLQALPESRLLLKTRQLRSEVFRRHVQTAFAGQGIEPGRLMLQPASRDYLRAYGEVDIALDPFPRTGGATTADALWMGVPVVTLAGERFIERQGASMLHALGLEELVACDEEDYFHIALRLARDPARRAALRRGLRQRMAASPLCDGCGLARALEAAYRRMWQAWVARRQS